MNQEMPVSFEKLIASSRRLFEELLLEVLDI